MKSGLLLLNLANVFHSSSSLVRYFNSKTLIYTYLKVLLLDPNKTFLKALRVARELNPDMLPSNFTLGGVPIAPSEIANTFALTKSGST